MSDKEDSLISDDSIRVAPLIKFECETPVLSSPDDPDPQSNTITAGCNLEDASVNNSDDSIRVAPLIKFECETPVSSLPDDPDPQSNTITAGCNLEDISVREDGLGTEYGNSSPQSTSMPGTSSKIISSISPIVNRIATSVITAPPHTLFNNSAPDSGVDKHSPAVAHLVNLVAMPAESTSGTVLKQATSIKTQSSKHLLLCFSQHTESTLRPSVSNKQPISPLQCPQPEQLLPRRSSESLQCPQSGLPKLALFSPHCLKDNTCFLWPKMLQLGSICESDASEISLNVEGLHTGQRRISKHQNNQFGPPSYSPSKRTCFAGYAKKDTA
jgi:hypothetical protein